ncbi:MAG: hypothetical protein Q9M34_12110 [Sulfurimonas sp.]|nr:hypothetical protein [Sulfurimonas sp.]
MLKLLLTTLLLTTLFSYEIVIDKTIKKLEISTFTRDNVKGIVSDSE